MNISRLWVRAQYVVIYNKKEALFHLRLHHGWSLCTQHFDCLEDVHSSLITHPLQHDTESDEHTRPTHARTEREREINNTVKNTACVEYESVSKWDRWGVREKKEVEEKVDSCLMNHSYLIN